MPIAVSTLTLVPGLIICRVMDAFTACIRKLGRPPYMPGDHVVHVHVNTALFSSFRGAKDVLVT